MNKKFLVIQGPIQSNGVSGKLRYDQPVVFNSLQCIKNNLKQHAHLFDQVVISSYEGEPISEDDIKEFDNVKLIKKEDDIEQLNSSMSLKFLLKSRQKRLNQWRQFLSFRNGLEAIENPSEDDFVIKLRTDMEVDLKAIIDCELDNSKIAAAGVFNNEFLDYYWSGSYKANVDMCRTLLNKCKANSGFVLKRKLSIHRAIPLIYYLENSKENISNFKEKFIIYLRSLSQTCNFNDQELKNVVDASEVSKISVKYFESLPQDILFRIVWRGDLIDKENFKKRNPNLQMNWEAFEPLSSFKVNWKNAYFFADPAMRKDYLYLFHPLIFLSFIRFKLLLKFKSLRQKVLKKHLK